MDSSWKLSSEYLICALYNEINHVCHRFKIQLLVKGSGKGKTASDCFAIAQQRQLLQTKIDQFQSQALSFMKKHPLGMSTEETYTHEYLDDINQLDFGEEGDEDNWLADSEEVMEEEPDITPEKVMLYIPSNFTYERRKEYGLQKLGNMELELRKGQANDSLERLRECLAEKSLRFRTEVRPAKSQKKMTRAWDSVHRMEDQIKQAVTTYRRARQAIRELGEATDLEKYQEITKSDLKMSGDIVEENRVGQKSSILPWFWRLDREVKNYHGDYEKECKHCNFRNLYKH
jgi:hypothetical protein